MPLLRTLSGLTVLAVCLAGCGGTAGPGSAGPTPQFVDPPATTTATTPAAAQVPVTPTTSAGGLARTRPPVTTPSRLPKKVTVKYAFPVKASNVDWHTTHSKYKATDIFADCGQPVVATTGGVVLEVSLTDKYKKGSPDGPNNGGLSVSLLGDDGVRYYGSHLSKVQTGIKKGVRVKAGQQLGKVGRTGNANNVCHLHYGISPPCAKVGDWKVRRGVVWPYSYLASWRKGGTKSPVAEVAAWKRSHNCKA
ncbi:M23 family metallopeptidase [Actinoplanes sp. TRM 88003]|uniref:M23 family metallopeptidase n=1 Tax=Paractinoplanes aksuensis TaxID=2939490 RepID=A0ABT1DWZ3_9ACTN|nr:peptidoglycan DD-metalloendopeptidase family protein [Actinoplanes aksuensis]MCO8274566.1 M23 family metallopeptidase [Actinoplanes aksuensis]